MEIVVEAALVIVLECVVPGSDCADLLSSVVADMLMNALTGAITFFVSDVGVEVFADVNFAVVMTALEFVMSITLEEFAC